MDKKIQYSRGLSIHYTVFISRIFIKRPLWLGVNCEVEEFRNVKGHLNSLEKNKENAVDKSRTPLTYN